MAALHCGGLQSYKDGRTAEPIEVRFAVWTPVRPQNHYLVGVGRIPLKRGDWGDSSDPFAKYRKYQACGQHLNVIRLVASAMRPFAVSTVATCFARKD